MRTQVEILIRYSTGTYVARVKGHKQTASCTVSALEAAKVMARKLDLDPEFLQEQQNDLLSPGKVVVFSHSGEQLNGEPQ